MTDWRGPSVLPAQLASFYREVGPVDITIEGYGNPYFLPSLARLWDHQAGYSYHPDGHTLEGWDSDWIVVADEGADPFIHERSTDRILHDLHGQGEWNPDPRFKNIFEMAGCLALIGSIVLEAGDQLVDELSYIQPQQMQRAADHLAPVLGSQAAALHLLSELGWASHP